jgi:hypothetical protein
LSPLSWPACRVIPAHCIGALFVGIVEAFGAFWASAFKEVIVFTLVLPVSADPLAAQPAIRTRNTDMKINASSLLLLIAIAIPLTGGAAACPTSGSRSSTTSGLYALVSMGLVLLTGVGGLTSFGQAAFRGDWRLHHRLADAQHGHVARG